MNRLLRALGHVVGMYFAPDNQVMPVLRLGRYHRIVGPGVCWLIPLVDRPLPLIHTGFRVRDLVFSEVVTADNIPFSLHLTVIFAFDPESLPKALAAQQVQATDDALHAIIRDRTSQGLRRLVSTFTADKLSAKSAMSSIERDLAHFLRERLRPMGLTVQGTGSVLIKEVIAPEQFRRSMLDARQHESTLSVFGRIRDKDLMMRVIMAEFLTKLGERDGNLALLSPLDAMPSLRFLDEREGPT